jgi:hypothetical protein
MVERNIIEKRNKKIDSYLKLSFPRGYKYLFLDKFILSYK